jgi:hypothetical protein
MEVIDGFKSEMFTMKVCKFDSSKRCFWFRCSRFATVSGIVLLCPNYRGGNFYASRKAVFNVSRFLLTLFASMEYRAVIFDG